MSTPILNKNIVMVTSLLECPKERNVYTRKERFNHTKLTITSVRKYIPDTYIAMIDCTELDEEEKEFFNNSVDLFINASTCKEVKDAVYSVCKSDGERMYMMSILSVLGIEQGFPNFPNLQNIYKISGRYYLNEEFNYSKYDHDKCAMRVVDPSVWPYTVQSCFFKISKSFYKTFMKMLIESGLLFRNTGFGMEQFLYMLIIQNILTDYVQVEPLGCSGLVATSKHGTLARV